MNRQDLKKTSLPDTPGVYFFKKGKDILYIGKATSISDRVKSYFSNDLISSRGPLLVDMVFKADKIDLEKTDSVLEAIILEAKLIKKHRPYYNTKEKDDKSFNYVVITEEEFPRVMIARGRDLKLNPKFKNLKVKDSFGPFTHGGALREAMKIIRRIFPYRDKCEPNQKKPCFNRQIGLCPGICSGEITKENYAKTIRHLILFFNGKKGEIIKNLEQEMREYAKERNFEKAGDIKKTIFALNHIRDVSLIKKDDFRLATLDSRLPFRIEAYDVAHLAGKNVVGVMTVIEGGEVKKSDYRKFIIKNAPGTDDTGALGEILERRLKHLEWGYPNLIVGDGGVAQLNVIKNTLINLGLKISVVSVKKDEKHRPFEILGDTKIIAEHKKEILLANAEAHRFSIKFHRQRRDVV